jgi:hypothetical protein
MPWLAEILADTTIPEEDRYWLDCRMRAVIAHERCTFFGRDGMAVRMKAAWVIPCGQYFLESFLIGLVPEDTSSTSSSVRDDETPQGLYLDRFGEALGAVAHPSTRLRVSRDASVAAGASYQESSDVSEHTSFALFFPDGTILNTGIPIITGDWTVSEDGSLALLVTRREQADQLSLAQALDEHGNALWQIQLEKPPVGTAPPVISLDGRFCAFVTWSGRDYTAAVYNTQDGSLIGSWDVVCIMLSFSFNGRYLFYSGWDSGTVDLETGEIIWSSSMANLSELAFDRLLYLVSCNDSSVYGAVAEKRLGSEYLYTAYIFDTYGHVLASDPVNGRIDISPNGAYTLTHAGNLSEPGTIAPIIVRAVRASGAEQ